MDPPGEWSSILKSYIYMAYLVFPMTLVTGISLYFYDSKYLYISMMFTGIGTVFLGYSMYSKIKGKDTWEQRIPISSELDKKKDLYLKIEKRFEENLEKSNFDFEEIDDPFPRSVVTVERHERTGKIFNSC